MVRRAGIPDSPQGVTEAVGIESGAEAMTAIARTWGEIGNVAGELRRKLQPAVNQNAVRQAGKAAAEGDYRQRWTLTEQDDAYNNAIQSAYLAKAQNDIDSRLGQIELDNRDNVDGFDLAAEAVKAEYVQQTPPDYALAVGDYLDTHIGRGRLRVAGRRQERAADEGLAALKSRLEVLDARNSELTPADGPEFAEYILDREAVLDAMRNPIYGVTEEEIEQNRAETYSLAVATAVGRAALDMYDEAPGAEGAARAYAFLDEQFQRTDLTLNSRQRDQKMGEARRAIAQAETTRRAAEREQRAEMRQLQSELRLDVEDGLVDLDAMLDASLPPALDEVDRLVSAAEAGGRPGQVRRARDLLARATVMTTLRTLQPAEQRAQMERWRTAAEAGDESALRNYREGLTYIDDLNRLRVTEPLKALVRHDGEPLAPIGTVDGWRARIEQAGRAAAAGGGVKPQYLLPQEREILAALSDKGGAEGFAVAMQIHAAADADAARRIFEEIGPNGAALGYAGMVLAESGNETAARRIMLGQKLMREAGNGQTGGGYRRATLEARDRDAAFDAYAPAGLSPEQRAGLRRAADLNFEGMFAENGTDTAAAYETAVREIFGERQIDGQRYGGVSRVRGMATPTPAWMRQDQFPVLMNGLSSIEWTAASVAGRPAVLTRGGRTEPVPLAALNQMKLISTGEAGRYYLSQRGAPNPDGAWAVVPDDTGSPFVLDLNKLRGAWARRRPDAVIPERPNGGR